MLVDFFKCFSSFSFSCLLSRRLNPMCRGAMLVDFFKCFSSFSFSGLLSRRLNPMGRGAVLVNFFKCFYSFSFACLLIISFRNFGKSHSLSWYFPLGCLQNLLPYFSLWSLFLWILCSYLWAFLHLNRCRVFSSILHVSHSMFL